VGLTSSFPLVDPFSTLQPNIAWHVEEITKGASIREEIGNTVAKLIKLEGRNGYAITPAETSLLALEHSAHLMSAKQKPHCSVAEKVGCRLGADLTIVHALL